MQLHFACIVLLTLIANGEATDNSCRLLINNSDWPSHQDWTELQRTLDGTLLRPRPPAAPCYDGNVAACNAAQAEWTDGYWRRDQPGAMQYTGREGWGNLSCPLDTTLSPACYQGSIPPYMVAAKSTDDIVKVIMFAKKENLRLSVKSSGHDFIGRSTLHGSLGIWLRRLQTLDFHDDFVSRGSGDRLGPALSVGPGIGLAEAFAAADRHGYVLTGGASSTVAPAGGYFQGGGHGPLTNMYGMAADNVLEFELVTADGKIRTVNSVQDADLFWAVRGGGAGTFGIVTRATFRLHATPKILTYTLTAQFSTNESYFTALETFFSEFPTLQRDGWSDYSWLLGNRTMKHFLLYPRADFTGANSSVKHLINGLSKLAGPGGFNISSTVYPSYLAMFNDEIVNNTLYGGVGVNAALGSWLVPPSANATALASVVYSRPSCSILSMLAGGNNTEVPADFNAVNPAWRAGPIFVACASFLPSGASQEETDAGVATTGEARAALEALAPESGAYVNEADYNQPNWQSAFWGRHYPRLLRIKHAYDPEGLFYCWHCVGSEEWDEEGHCRVNSIHVQSIKA